MSESGIFKAAVKLPPQERASYLGQACGSNAELRREVESLLRSYDASGTFLHDHASRTDATDDYEPITDGPGTTVGPYKLMERIGEGGMGLVFVAEQHQPVRRKVALKIIKPGMDTRDVIARFEAERQALALMEHPNIAKVFDVGTTASGRPYFVMELVKGIPIIDYCDQQQLTAGERLGLFLSVCQAVQHAHGKGIIHRDLKPSNILVASHDGIPVVKVIDFGVAKAIGQQLTDKTIYTRFTQMIGTPLYMSPEQAEFNALDVDIRSDVYSLGVLLYELLTGTTPFDRKRFATAAYDEIRRIIKEEEPPKPSTRLSTMGESLAKVSSQRNTEPAKLSALVRGDLDWMVMKALEKDRGRRYDTASAFAADVRRFLADEPIEARPPSTWYRFRKMARRNKVALTTAALVAAALLLGTAISTWQAMRARRAETVARIRAKQAQVSAKEAQTSAALAEDRKREADGAKQKAEKRSDELTALNDKLRRLNYITDMNLARQAWDQNGHTLARELLERHRPKPGETDLRGFEWYYLHRLQHRERIALSAYDGWATTVAWTPDGKRLVTFGVTRPEPVRPIREWFQTRTGGVKLWDAATGRHLPLRLDGTTDKLTSGYLSPDGKRLAASCGDQGVRIWNLETGELIATLETYTADIFTRIVFSLDNKRMAIQAMPLAANSHRAEIRIWDLETRKSVVSFDIPDRTSPPIFSPDGKRLAAVKGHLLKVWETASGHEILAKDLKRNSWSVAFSPDGNCLAVTDRNKGVEILDAGTGALVKTYAADDSAVLTNPTFSPDGKQLLAADVRSGLVVWNAESGRPFRRFTAQDTITDIAFSPDGTLVASAGMDGSVKVWDTAGEPETLRLPAAQPNESTGTPVVLSFDGRIALTGLAADTLHLWNTATGKPLGEPLKLEHKVANWDFTADGKRLVLTDLARNVTIWDSAAGKKVHAFKHDGPEGPIKTNLSPDGKWFACQGQGRGLNVWDVEKGVEFRTFPGLSDRPSFQFSPDSARLAMVHQGEVVKVWDVATGRELCSAKFKDRGTMVSFSTDSKRLAVTCFGIGATEMHIIDADSGQDVSPPIKGTFAGNMVFSPDGKRLVTGAFDGSVKFWDLTSGQQILTLKGHAASVDDLAFRPDGHRLITVSSDMTIRVWDATPLPEFN